MIPAVPSGRCSVAHRVEHRDVEPGRGEQFGVLGVAEGEGGTPRDRDHGTGSGRGVRDCCDCRGSCGYRGIQREGFGGVPGRAGEGAGAAGQGEQARQVTGVLDERGQPGHRVGGGTGTLGGGDQAQMAGRRGDLGRAADRAVDRDPGDGQGVAEQPFVPVRRDPVEDHPGHRRARIEPGEAGRDGGHRASHRGGVDDQDDGRAQQPRDVGRGAEAGISRAWAGAGAGSRVRAVEQAHHAFDDGDVRAPGRVEEQRDDPVRTAQERVQVPGRAPGGQRVVAGIDVVRAGLVAGDGEAGRAQRGHQPAGHRGLPAARGRGRDHEPGGRHHSIPFWPFWPRSIGCLTFVMSVTRLA